MTGKAGKRSNEITEEARRNWEMMVSHKLDSPDTEGVRHAVQVELKLRQAGKTDPEGAWRIYFERDLEEVYSALRGANENISFDQVEVFKKMMPIYINIGFAEMRSAQHISWLVSEAVRRLRDDPIFQRRFGNKSTQLFLRTYDDPASTYKKKRRGPRPKLWRDITIVGVIESLTRKGWPATRGDEPSGRKVAPDGRMTDCTPLSAADMVAKALFRLGGRRITAEHVIDIYHKNRKGAWEGTYTKNFAMTMS